ncbi:ABC transporter ATP-binding protein [Alkalicoccobacillus murimartini]|uniref:Iron complex transport system ATP-binding protein n=1 Tax=Alkalicoccobacillus murimartini TaxID=171685 RepID=A0ABT9YET3_9BACI|nr:ABC transporter ATP-binding protein [Alkalicoccobacillus murimartini]MDQ0206010.1 iron complex transport system ATP-binding protein [Alkalicoccobacillus murimartini]
MSTNIISLEDVSWRRQNKQIVKNVHWNVEQGEHWAILGANGSGKTSLLKIITGYEWASNGTVDVLGERFGQTPIYELRKRIGWLSASLDERFRHYEGLACVDVVVSGIHASIGIHDDIKNSDIQKALKLANEMGLSHIINSPLRSLSQGERKKTFFARALMADPELIIVDEPTSGLDLLAREQFLQQLQTLHSKPDSPTLLYVTHYPEEIIPSISHVLLLKEGQIIAAGKKEDVLTNTLLSQTFDVPIYVVWRDGRPWIQIASNSFKG